METKCKMQFFFLYQESVYVIFAMLIVEMYVKFSNYYMIKTDKTTSSVVKSIWQEASYC